MLECLADLDASLRERGSGLVIRQGRAGGRAGASWPGRSAPTRCTSRPTWARSRGAVEAVRWRGLGASSCARIPGSRRWTSPARSARRRASPRRCSRPSTAPGSRHPAREVLGAPRTLPALPSGLAKGRLPSLDSLGLEQEVSEPPPGGEGGGAQAHERLAARRRARLRRTTTTPSGATAPRGCRPTCTSAACRPREIEERLPRGTGPEAFRRQLCWRDFYHHVILHFPRNARSEFQERYRGTISWSHAEKALRGAGARAAPASRWWTPGCASCGARAGCTTGRGSWWARS